MPLEVILTCIMIFFSRICDVTFMSLRTILMTKGIKKIAAFMAFFEVLIYMTVLTRIVNGLSDPVYLLSYCAGFATGTFIGTTIEQQLAFGDSQMRIIISGDDHSLVDELRKMGYGVTVFDGEGKDGKRLMLLINLKRKKIKTVYKYISEKGIRAFVSTNDITSYKGGYQTVVPNEQPLHILSKKK